MGTVSMGCFGDGEECRIRDPLCGAELIGASVLMIISLMCFGLCPDGLNTIPKCRYGEPECFFVVTQKDLDGNNEMKVFKNRAVEGDSDSSYEQLAIPLLVTLFSLLPPVLIFIATIFNQSLRTIEIGKYFLTGCSVVMLMSIRIVD